MLSKSLRSTRVKGWWCPMILRCLDLTMKQIENQHIKVGGASAAKSVPRKTLATPTLWSHHLPVTWVEGALIRTESKRKRSYRLLRVSRKSVSPVQQLHPRIRRFCWGIAAWEKQACLSDWRKENFKSQKLPRSKWILAGKSSASSRVCRPSAQRHPQSRLSREIRMTSSPGSPCSRILTQRARYWSRKIDQ